MKIATVPSFVMTLVFVGMILGAGLLALSAFQTSMTANTAEYNATGNAITSGLNLSAQLGTVGTIAGVAILISVVVGALYFGRK